MQWTSGLELARPSRKLSVFYATLEHLKEQDLAHD